MVVAVDAVPSFLPSEETRMKNLKAWVLLATFLVSFGYALVYRIEPSVDARKFNTIAVNLVTKGTFCFECDVPLAKDRAIRDIGPGIQFFLAGVYKIFGIHQWIVWLLQAMMHTVVVFWLWGLTRKITGRDPQEQKILLLPLALYAFHPDIVQQNAMLMSESLFTFLLVGAFMATLRLVERKSLRWAAFVGLLIGATFMVRPTGLPVLVVVVGYFVWRKWWKHALIIFLAAACLQIPWTVRNMNVYDRFILNSVVGGLDFWVGLYPDGPGEFDMDNLPEITSKIAGLDPDQLDYVSMMETKKIIQEQPFFAIGRTIQKGFKLFALTKTSGFWFHYRSAVDQAATVATSIAFNAAMWSMTFAALVWMAWKRRVPGVTIGLAAAFILLLGAAPTLTVVVNRYRVPMLPFAVLLSSWWLVSVRGRERWISLLWAWAFLIVATCVDVWGSFPKIAERVQRIRVK